MAKQYKGARWFKCDLHLHTPASRCFLDQNVTPDEWVKACLSAGLQCVAVTDHNTGAWIDNIKDAAQGTGLTVFPGVEVTCDTSKIHLLLIFDESKSTQQIEDFLLTCGISREMFADQNAHSSMTVIDIANKANEVGALVIPAHIDEFNGLAYCAARSSVNDFFSLPFVHAVQFVHEEFLDTKLQIKGNKQLLESINSYYGKSTIAIGENDIKNAIDGIVAAKVAKMRLLTFSDNPDELDPAKHGLSGIGSRYTWIKMDSKPSLEGLRQAFMMPDRTVHYFKRAHCPYNEPKLWIRKISIQNTVLTKNNDLFEIEFNPQLTTIIGGRGSGKSSVLRFLRGAFGHDKDLEKLVEIKEDQKQFFKKVDENGLGVLKDDTRIEVYFVRDNLEYRIVYDKGNSSTVVEQYDVTAKDYIPLLDEGFIDFFQFEEYSQKQIFSIAQKPNSLRNRIDSAIPALEDILAAYRRQRQEYRSMTNTLRALQRAVQDKGKLNTEIKDLNSKIELLKQSDISSLINQQQSFNQQRDYIRKYVDYLKKLIDKLKTNIPEFESLQPFNSEVIDEKYRDDVSKILNESTSSLQDMGTLLKQKYTELDKIYKKATEQLMAGSLYRDALISKQQFEKKKAELGAKGVTDMTDFEKFTRLLNQKNEELKQILLKEAELSKLTQTILQQQQIVSQKRIELSQKRRDFVNSCINSDKIKISIRPYYDQTDFRDKFRKIVQKELSYENGISKIVEMVYESNDILGNLARFKDTMHALHDDKLPNNPFDGRFTSLIQGLTDAQMDDIDLLYPEDQIEMRYKGRDGNFKPLSAASAGQKTTAILTFILSFGKTPLVLDQPEDDLDNRLVYDLIVDKIRQIKETRQVIVVTHNANIPVNGDAEYVVSMSSDTHNLKIQAEGTVENDKVKNEICEVMEGGVEAFRTRAKRYESLNKN